MVMEYRAEILRGWPQDGARERNELVKSGSTLFNGDLVEVQADGTVALTGATKTRRAGLVVRGNGDSQSAGNSQGFQPATVVVVSGVAWAGGVATVTTTGNHGLAVGNTVALQGFTPVGYNGYFSVASVTSATVFTVALAVNPGAVTVQGTTQLVFNTLAGANAATQATTSSGKAVVLWGNYIVRTQNYTQAPYVPGSPVTVQNGKFVLANGTTDPEVGFVLRVYGSVGGVLPGNVNPELPHLVISVY